MSTIKVTNLRGRNGSPNLPDGAVVTGVVTATSFSGSGANLTGLANTAFINAEQVTVVGVVTAGSYRGDGSNLTGVGETIAPWNYNPDVSDQEVGTTTGIGISFNKKITAGSGTATLKMVNAVSGVAGTTIQSWGISSATISNVTDLTFGALVSPLTVNKTYQFDIPSGFIKDGNDNDYVGTAWTFSLKSAERKMWSWGNNTDGCLGLNQASVQHSSPAQIGEDTTWAIATPLISSYTVAVKTNGTLWLSLIHI